MQPAFRITSTSWDCACAKARRSNRGPILRQPAKGRRPRVGVLGGSSADRFVTAEYGASCEIVRFEGTVETFLLVDSGQLDATVQDLPALEFYLNRLKRYPRLRIVDHPAQPGYYVLYARRS